MSRLLIPIDKELGKIFKDELVSPGPYFPYQSLKKETMNMGTVRKIKEVQFNNNVEVREKDENIFENIVETGEDVANTGKDVANMGVVMGKDVVDTGKDVVGMGIQGTQDLMGNGTETVNELIESSGDTLKELIDKSKNLISNANANSNGNANGVVEGYSNNGGALVGAPLGGNR